MVKKDNEQEHNQSKEDREDHLFPANRQDISEEITEEINDFPFFLPSSIICKVGEDTVEGCADEEDHSGFPVHPEWYVDPSKSCTELDQDQDHVDKPKDQNDRNPADFHMRSSHC